MDFGLKGRHVAITGGASGVGLATAHLLGRGGARITVIDIRDGSVEAAVAELKAAGVDAVGFAADVCDADRMNAVAALSEDAQGPAKGLVACAGIAATARAEDLSAEEISRIVGVNTIGVFLSCQAYGRRMLASGGGAIVAISSVSGFGGQPGRTAYVASKHAVNGIVRSLAIEWGNRGIRVNAVAPNFIDTPMVRSSIPPKFLQSILGRTPLGRGAQPVDIAGPIGFLLSDVAGYMNGATLPVDGCLMAGFMTQQGGLDFASNSFIEKGIYSE